MFASSLALLLFNIAPCSIFSMLHLDLDLLPSFFPPFSPSPCCRQLTHRHGLNPFSRVRIGLPLNPCLPLCLLVTALFAKLFVLDRRPFEDSVVHLGKKGWSRESRRD
ncbi:hypothetical protein AVEN_87163-1 [Araneus ventricosus]|uniref:Uncharacterized protein n=1 Tax=Araneus ventricosus TaxID=182803 RepID=A0A4Y2H145_ARAVE|nr:hypothetical protein AVEN_87163-1 [Araneus ventricosus]